MNKKGKEITEIARKNGINVQEDSIKINDSGLDFQVVHAIDNRNEKWVLRIPRRKDVMAKTDLEKSVLDTVNKHVSFEVPVWSVYTDDLIAYKQLSGVPAGTIDPEIQNYVWEFDINNVPESYHASIGKVLAKLHHVPKEKLSLPGLTLNGAEEAKASMIKRMNEVKETYGVREDLWARWQTWLANDEMWPEHTGLIHGDVHAGHTLINEQAEVTGLIDWTEAAVTDVSRDFIGHLRTFGEPGLEKAIAAYSKAGGVTWPLMKEHIIELTATYAIDIAEFAKVSGEKEYERMAKEALGVLEED